MPCVVRTGEREEGGQIEHISGQDQIGPACSLAGNGVPGSRLRRAFATSRSGLVGQNIDLMCH